MNTFFTILANDYRRTVPRLAGTLIMTFVMFVMILLAVYVTHLQQIKGHIAYIPSGTDVSVPGHPSYLDVTVLLTEPPRSSLYKQTYDAVVRAGADGTITVDTLRNDAFRAMVVRAFSTRPGADAAVPQPAGTAARNTGVNIVGFLLMFLLMQSFSNMFVFADDKEQGQLVRISSTPAPFASYLAAHCVYSVSLIAPSWIILAVLDACGVNVGFTLAEYALLILVISFSGVCSRSCSIRSSANRITRICSETRRSCLQRSSPAVSTPLLRNIRRSTYSSARCPRKGSWTLHAHLLPAARAVTQERSCTCSVSDLLCLPYRVQCCGNGGRQGFCRTIPAALPDHSVKKTASTEVSPEDHRFSLPLML